MEFNNLTKEISFKDQNEKNHLKRILFLRKMFRLVFHIFYQWAPSPLCLPVYNTNLSLETKIQTMLVILKNQHKKHLFWSALKPFNCINYMHYAMPKSFAMQTFWLTQLQIHFLSQIRRQIRAITWTWLKIAKSLDVCASSMFRTKLMGAIQTFKN